MRLEAACQVDLAPLAVSPDWDWRPWLASALADPAALPTQLHRWLIAQATATLSAAPEPTLILGGGCFQNRLLLEAITRSLQACGRTVHWARHLPPNDGGLALGQAIAARYALTENWSCASPSPE
jgi:hydrogenase maturation protein HypF